MLDLSNIRILQWLTVLLLLVIVELNPTDRATIAWNAGDDKAEWYEIRYRSTDLEPQQVTEVSKLNSLEAQAIRPRSGHWAVEVRACRMWEEEVQCSDYVKSDVGGEPTPWVIFWKPPPTTGIVVEEGVN